MPTNLAFGRWTFIPLVIFLLRDQMTIQRNFGVALDQEIAREMIKRAWFVNLSLPERLAAIFSIRRAMHRSNRRMKKGRIRLERIHLLPILLEARRDVTTEKKLMTIFCMFISLCYHETFFLFMYKCIPILHKLNIVH